jgi:polyhydroxyalkanoate synthase
MRDDERGDPGRDGEPDGARPARVHQCAADHARRSNRPEPTRPVWTHRNTTLYRYRSAKRHHAVPILLVFVLIPRPEVVDLRPRNSFVEFVLTEGFDVFLVDRGVADEEDANMGLAEFVNDEVRGAVRETLRERGQDELTLLGWCIGGTLCAMYCAPHFHGAVRNAVPLTTPIDPSASLYARWVGRDDFDVDLVADSYLAVPSAGVDVANKLTKPVTNYRRLFGLILEGRDPRQSYQAVPNWVADDPPSPGKAYSEWIA